MWWDSKKEYLKIVNSSNDDKGWGWAAGRRRRNLAWIWISQHLNGTSPKKCPCAKWSLEQVWFAKSALLNVDKNVEKSLRNILPIFLLLCGHIFDHPADKMWPLSSQNSYWDYYGSFHEQRLFSVEFARFRNFFDFAQIWGILESDKLWEIQCCRVADGKDESW